MASGCFPRKKKFFVSLVTVLCFLLMTSVMDNTRFHSQFYGAADSDLWVNTLIENPNTSVPDGFWVHHVKSSECTQARPFKRGNLPLTNLLSMHGSGNTWLRWMIERMTGICTGSLYSDTLLRRAGFSCEDYVTKYLFKKTIAVRSHYYSQLNATKIILLVRNPYHAIVADFNRQTSDGNHTGLADVNLFYSNDWRTFAASRVQEWTEQLSASFEKAQELLVVFFENLKTDLLHKEMQRVGVFLRVAVPETRLKCALKTKSGRVRRPLRVLPGNIWTPVLRQSLNSAMCGAFELFLKNQLKNIPKFYKTACSSTEIPNDL